MHLFVRRSTLALSVACVLAGSSARADEHVVTQVINGFVYVSLGARDGAAVGMHVEIVGAAAEIELDFCGEVVCRGKLPAGAAIDKGMTVRIVAPIKTSPTDSTPSPPPVVVPAPPTAVTPPPPIVEEFEPEPKPKATKKKPPARTGLTLDTTLEPYFQGPKEMRWKEGPVPPGYRVVDRPNDGLVKAGWWMFGVSYGLTATVGLGSEEYSLLVPAIGPWIYAGMHSQQGSGAVVLSGLLQDVGALLLTFGYVGSKRFVRQDLKVSFAPMIGRDVVGLAAGGTL